MFPALLKNPTNLFFAGQDPDEEIVLLVRAHPITNLYWIVPAILIFLIPFVVPIIFSRLGFNILSRLSEAYLMALLVINYLLVLVIVFEGFLYWYFNVNILTNERLINTAFNNLLSNNQDVAMLDDIQEVTPSRMGLLALIFDLGNVEVQTAGAKVGIEMLKIPSPYEVADLVLEQSEKWKGQ